MERDTDVLLEEDHKLSSTTFLGGGGFAVSSDLGEMFALPQL